MADGNIKTTLQFQADITDFKAAMQESNRAIKLANSEFAAASSGMDDWSKSTEGLQAKLQQLATVQAAQQQKLAALRAEYDKVVAAEGESSRAAQELAIKINNQQAAVNKTGQEIKTYTGKLEEAERATDDLGDAANDAGKDAAALATDIDKAEQETFDFAAASEKASSIVAGAFAAIGAACAAVVTGFLAMAESSREYRVAMGKIGTAFEDVGMSATMGKELYMDFYAVLGDQDKAVEAISNLAMLTQDQQALAEWTTIATGVYAKFGDALPIESLTEAANETAKTGALTGALADALNWAGVSEEEFQAQLDACNTEAEREALIRSTLNGLYADAGAQYREVNGDIIAANEAQARMTDAMAQLGAKAEPIMTAIKNGFADIVEAAASFLTDVDMDSITASIENAFAWFIETAVPAIKDGISWVIDNSGLILSLITGIGAGMVAWNAVQIISGAVNAFKTLKTTIDLVKTGQLALNVALNANPIGIIIALVAGLVAGFIALWNNCESFRNFFINMWEGIKSFFAGIVDWFAHAGENIAGFFTGAWESIKNAWSSAGEWFAGVRDKITGAFQNVGNWFSKKFTQAYNLAQKAWAGAKEHFGKVKDGITGAFSNIDTWMGDKFGGAWTAVKKAFSPFVGYFQQIWNTVKGIFSVVKSVLSGNFSDAWAAIKGIFAGWGSYFSGLWQNVKDIFANVGSWFKNIGGNIVEGIWSGISSGYNWIKEKITGWVGDVVGFFKNLFGIHSPSTVMRDEVGKMLGAGMAEGITDSRKAVNGAVQQLSDAALDSLTRPRGPAPAAAAGKTINFYQTNNSPKALTRREIYRQTFNALAYAGGG